MKNEYEMTLNDEILLDLINLQEEFTREVAELEALDQMDAGYIDE
jgi:hypothetical protein